MPAYNEGTWVRRALDALEVAASRADWPLEVVVVDDGATDPESLEVLAEVDARPHVTVVHQANEGRFAARSRGLDLVTTELVLLLDARVQVDPESLGRIRAAVSRGERVWNYDVTPASTELAALFWTGITKVWWRDYFRDRRAVAFGPDDFDRYPKGTTAFLAPAQLLRDAAAGFESHFDNRALASDDTRLLRAVAEVEHIHLSPDVMCRHHVKSGRTAWMRQCYYRGTTFVDGYLGDPGRAGSMLAGAAGAGALGLVVTWSAPRATAAAAVVGCASTASVTRWAGGTPRESVAVGLLTPAFGVLFGAGVVRGLRMAAGRRGR
ncbi:glycosyltransferase [Nocardioides baculatus]|uniref:Glycosyltransferase n=1 Tax=Nocardioides baculatus TaxID=2801337 RepID=A0ABS1L6N8_9ACTN|nr:glycosyltransferase [Nocardioides baculatus]MBL0747197.1 glycosyltransferase [Nocardioides baculatus]